MMRGGPRRSSPTLAATLVRCAPSGRNAGWPRAGAKRRAAPSWKDSNMSEKSKLPVCAVIGIGPGNGEALARRFTADGFVVALMARRAELTMKLAAELKGARAYACDVADEASVE